jgi:hypothetical protein
MPRKREPRKRPPRNRSTHDQQKAFIAAFALSANLSAAAKAVKIERARHYDWIEFDEPYRRAFEAVQDQAAQTLEDEAVRRAYEGIRRPMYYRGKPVKTGGRRGRQVFEVEYSDTLLLALLKRFRPALYRDKVVAEVTGSIDLVERLQAGRQRLLQMQTKEEAG